MDKQTITLLDYFLLFYRQKWLILVITTLSTVAGILYSYTIPPVYKSTAVIIQAEAAQNPGLSLGGLASLALGGAASSAADGETKKIKALLQSYTLSESVLKNNPELVERINSAVVGGKKRNIGDAQSELVSAANTLKGWIKAADNTELGVMNIVLSTPQPKLSRDLALEVLKELRVIMTDLSNISARQTREFIARQLTIYRKEFLEAGKLLSTYYQQNNITSNKTTLEVNVSPDYHFLETKLEAAKTSQNNVFSINDKFIDTKKTPPVEVTAKGIPHNVFFEYLAAHREILRIINGSLIQQYENAKVDEAKQSMSFQLLDLPVVSNSFSKTKRRIVMLMGFAGGAALSIFICLVRELIRTKKQAT